MVLTVAHFCGIYYGLATPTMVPYYAVVFTVPGAMYAVLGNSTLYLDPRECCLPRTRAGKEAWHTGLTHHMGNREMDEKLSLPRR